MNNEIILVESISSNTLTVARGQLGTSLGDHNNNSQIYWHNFFHQTKLNPKFYLHQVLNQ